MYQDSNKEIAAAASSKTFAGVVDGTITVITQIVLPILFALALMYFLLGVIKFIRSAGDEKERAEAKRIIFSGLIGLAVMVSIWGLVAVVAGSFGQGLILPQIDGKNININSFR